MRQLSTVGILLYRFLSYLVSQNVFRVVSALQTLRNFEVETYSFKFAIHVSDDQHPSLVANTNEPALVGIIKKRT